MKTMKLLGETVPRIGYGTMRLPGNNVWGPAKDHDAAIDVLKRVNELGIKVIDTAWYYGPNVSNELLAEALYPYPEDLIIITKLGGKRGDDGKWLPYMAPEELFDGMERDLKLLKLDSVDIAHLRWMGKDSVDQPFIDSVDAMISMKQSGKMKEIGLSNVSEPQLEYVLGKTNVASVSNAYNFEDRTFDGLVDRCAEEAIAFLPYFPLGTGKLSDNALLNKWAEELRVQPSQVALAWLIYRSPTMLPIPGTASIEHLEDNFAAADLELPQAAIDELNQV